MYREQVVIENLRRCYPDRSEAERNDIKRRFYRHLWDVVTEVVRGTYASEAYMDQHVDIQVGDMLDVARQHGGVMMMLGHIGCWEWIADYGRRIEPLGFTQHNVYRRQKNRLADRLICWVRRRRGGDLIEKDQLLRRMVALRKAKSIPCYGILADQHPSPKSAQVWTTFMGQETAFLTGSEQLAKRFGYPCYYVHIRQTARHHYAVTTVRMTGEGYEGEYPITQEFAHRLEENINEQPEQWLWTHKRWKWQKPQS